MTDDGGSYLSQLADEMEAVQLTAGETVLSHAAEMLADQKVEVWELRFLGHRLCEALRDALRVAESRGARLPEVDHEDGPDDSPAPCDGKPG
ncbi:hypothetical protein ABTZ59_11830 [Streptomyces sp. NPDC094034]|uniref:hypothetical protein n=1 Tax=Streptomyces sp. NPDC094034 TaxID=3155309 RepID=UPI0033314CDA